MFIERFVKLGSRLLPLMGLMLLAACDLAEEPAASPTMSSEQAVGPDGMGALQFVRGFEAGLQEAHREGRPMLVFFTAQWCDYCHQMAKNAFTDRQVVQLADRFVCVLVDADSEPIVCERFGVKAFPTVQFVSPQGIPLKRLVGKKEAPQLAYEMRVTLQTVALRSHGQQMAPR